MRAITFGRIEPAPGPCGWCHGTGEVGPPEDRYVCPCPTGRAVERLRRRSIGQVDADFAALASAGASFNVVLARLVKEMQEREDAAIMRGRY